MAAKIGLSLYESPLSERHRPAGVLLAHRLAEGVILVQVQVGEGRLLLNSQTVQMKLLVIQIPLRRCMGLKADRKSVV